MEVESPPRAASTVGRVLKPVDGAGLDWRVGRVRSVISQARGHVLAPDARKKPPVFSPQQLQLLVGLERSQFAYRRRNAGGLPTGTTVGSSRRSVFSLEDVRQWTKHFNRERMRPAGMTGIVVAMANFKGGSAKTTTCLALAQGLSLRGHDVLTIDCDPQGSLTTLFGLLPHADVDDVHTLLPLLSGDVGDASGLVRSTYWSGVDLIAARPSLYSAEFVLHMRSEASPSFVPGRVLDLGLDALRERYDVILIDTPPQLSFLTLNALQAADGVLMPLPPQALDFASSALFWELYRDVSKISTTAGRPKEFEFLRVLLSKVRNSAPLTNTGQSTRIIEHWIRAAYADEVLPIEIPELESVRTSAKDFGTPYDVLGREALTPTFKRAMEAYDRAVDEIEQLLVQCWADRGASAV